MRAHLVEQGLAYSRALQCKCRDAPGRQEPATLIIHPRIYLIRPLESTGPSGMIPAPAQCSLQSSSCQVGNPSATPKDQETSCFSQGVQCPTECPQVCGSHLRSVQLLRQQRQRLSKIMTTRRPPASNTREPASPSKGTSLRISGRRHLRQSHPTPRKSFQHRKRSTLLCRSHAGSVHTEAAHTSAKQYEAPRCKPATQKPS